MRTKKSILKVTLLLMLGLIFLAGLYGIVSTNGGPITHGAMKVAAVRSALDSDQ